VPTRIAVVGTTCAGKTTVAKRLAERHGVPHVELDALHWGPGWSEPSAEQFRVRVREALAGEEWVADGGYHGKLGDLVLAKAELIVWLDPPLPTVLRRLGSRTVRRVRSGEELWGGNRETWRGAFLSRDSLFVWAVTTHRPRRARYEKRLAGYNVVRLRSARETQDWLGGAKLTAESKPLRSQP
jgi:adenylate kinase family enzyme